MEHKIKTSQRKALSIIIGSASIAISNLSTLALKLDDFPEAVTPSERELIEKMRDSIHKYSIFMLNLSHKLREPSDANLKLKA